MNIIDLQVALNKEFPSITLLPIKKESFIFEERVRQKCFHCKNYNLKWTCPPKSPDVNYPVLFNEYDNAAVLIYKVNVNNSDFEEQRTYSTNIIHKACLYLEKILYTGNNPMAISFIGGSCKLCKNGCHKEHCVNPYASRMPWEATGCNVIETLRRNDISVIFPITDTLYRYGLILW